MKNADWLDVVASVCLDQDPTRGDPRMRATNQQLLLSTTHSGNQELQIWPFLSEQDSSHGGIRVGRRFQEAVETNLFRGLR
jgi:hypothetical protein